MIIILKMRKKLRKYDLIFISVLNENIESITDVKYFYDNIDIIDAFVFYIFSGKNIIY